MSGYPRDLFSTLLSRQRSSLVIVAVVDNDGGGGGVCVTLTHKHIALHLD